MKLTEQQLNHFETFGFLIFRQLLSAREMETYSREFGAGHDAFEGPCNRTEGHYASLMEEASPFIAGLADDPRFGDVAEQLLRKKSIGIAVDGSYMVGDTNWHPDTGSLDYMGIKFCIYPDRLDVDSGALRVIPGSHREPFHSDISRDPDETYGVSADQLPAFVFDSAPGDVVAFNVGLWHGSFGGAAGRRQGVVVYYEDPDTPAAKETVVSQMQGNHGLFLKCGRSMYGEHWRSIQEPRHQRWLRRLDELGVLETTQQ